MVPRDGVVSVPVALPEYLKSKLTPAPLPMTGDIGVKSTTAPPLAAILSARLAPPSAVTCSVFMLKPVPFQVPTRHASRPVSGAPSGAADASAAAEGAAGAEAAGVGASVALVALLQPSADRKSTRLNSSHSQISYAVFC